MGMLSEKEIETRKKILLLDLEKHIEEQDIIQKEILKELKKIEYGVGIVVVLFIIIIIIMLIIANYVK